jgi:hypothetical protein
LKKITFQEQGTTIAAHHRIKDFFLQPPRSQFKNVFLRSKLGEQFQVMSFAKSVPKGLKWIECKCGIRGKNSPVCYIPEHNPVQDALEKSKKTLDMNFADAKKAVTTLELDAN